MQTSKTDAIKSMFLSRLNTLEHIIETGEKHFGRESAALLEYKLISDMHPFATQVVYTCNQPYNFSRWCAGKTVKHIDPDVQTISRLQEIVADVKTNLNSASAEDSRLDEITVLELGDNTYIELSGSEYLQDFLVPNFYFHLVTAYDILRMNGVQIGKHDYMLHLVPRIRQR